MLEIDRLQVSIQSAEVLRGLSLTVGAGRMVGLIGRNGAGKTTTLRAIMGHLPLVAGTIHFDGQDLSRLPPHARAGLGIGYMPEDRGLVPELSVEENILVPLWATGVADTSARLAFVYQVLPELHEMRERRALLLSRGDPMIFVNTPISLGFLIAAGLLLLVVAAPAIRKKREEAMVE